MKRYPILILLLSLLLSSCDFLTNKFCGDLAEVEQNMVDTAKRKYGDYMCVKPIPCEFLYIDIQLKKELQDTTLLDRIHAELYNAKTTNGWQDIVVYDTKGKYLFTHTYKGQIFKAKSGY